MAPNYRQSQSDPSLDSPPSDTSASDDLQSEVQQANRSDGRFMGNSGAGTSSNNNSYADNFDRNATPNYPKILNEAHLIQNRRMSSNHRARKDLELMCEDKVSKYKLEEVHCSLPSCVKSTFIMTFSPDGQRVASTHGNHRIYICDLNTGKLLDTLEGHPKTPWCLAWHPSNRDILASGCLAGEVRVWDLRSKACELWNSENNTIITSLDFHPKERVLVIATANDIHFWDWSESEPFAKTTTTHDKEKVKFVLFDSSGTKLITGISNLPKFAGYSSDSLQNRIIDSYLTHGTLDQLSTENMTQNSEIVSPINGALNESSSERGSAQLNSNRQVIPVANNNEQDINYRSTVTLSRVSFYYRQLEALEDSMRNTSFTPFTNPRPINNVFPSVDPGLFYGGPTELQQQQGRNQQHTTDNSENVQQSSFTSETGPTPVNIDIISPSTMNNQQPQDQQQASSQGIIANASQSRGDAEASIRSTIASNAFEPFVVSFDESLEQLQLTPLIVGGQTINLATVIEQYPIDLPYQLHYMMQFESINQVNQNFIRISKLMSSVRLYRQVVQQILSSNSGQGHYQPNQILTAQSTSPRSPRHASNLPIFLRRSPGVNSFEPNNLLNRGTRPIDPILAIQFRNSARNVPLVMICKIDLLSARAACIWRSQQLLEQVILGMRPATEQTSNDESTDRSISGSNNLDRSPQVADNNSSTSTTPESDNIYRIRPFSSHLNQLHQYLLVIKHAPLTTSNVHTHITLLRSLLNKLLSSLSSMFQTIQEGRRLIELIHNIAHSLTSRSWNIPLGATLDDIRLDVIHTLCIVDLSLHLARQVQLLQMQRLSAVARIEESRRSGSTSSNREATVQSTTVEPSSTSGSQADISQTDSASDQQPVSFDGPSTSRGGSTFETTSKRKQSESATSGCEESAKRARVDSEEAQANLGITNQFVNKSIDTISNTARQTPESGPITSEPNSAAHNTPVDFLVSNQPDANVNASAETASPDRLAQWNGSSPVEQSLQRFLVATASSMGNSHILVRIYHRLHGNSPASSASNTVLDHHSNERPNPPCESRRRALSQDNSASASAALPLQESTSPTLGSNEHGGRGAARQAVHSNHQANSPGSSAAPGGLAFEAWQRHPHLHVYQTRGAGQHLWFNQWTIPLPVSNSNYRLQCWNFSMSAIPNIKDSQSNIVTQKCRIHNDSSIDISSNGFLIACLVPRDDGSTCLPSFDLKIFSLRSYDFGACYYQVPHGPNAISVSLSPSAGYAVVGLGNNKFINNDPSDDDLTIAKVFKLNGRNSYGYVRDIKIKRDDSSLSLNAIRWMSRGIVYNVGPQHHQRYQPARVRNRAV